MKTVTDPAGTVPASTPAPAAPSDPVIDLTPDADGFISLTVEYKTVVRPKGETHPDQKRFSELVSAACDKLAADHKGKGASTIAKALKVSNGTIYAWRDGESYPRDEAKRNQLETICVAILNGKLKLGVARKPK